MEAIPATPELHRRRSEFIRGLVQSQSEQAPKLSNDATGTPRAIIQFWNDLTRLPRDVEECIASWRRWSTYGIEHKLFDENLAKEFIGDSLGGRHVHAFERCYHPAMQSDYFRLCYVLAEGGLYVDADDVCVGESIVNIFDEGRLRLSPLCYDLATSTMIDEARFISEDAYDPNWIFYFNNNPLIAAPKNKIIEHALLSATNALEFYSDEFLPEIQETTGPGNVSRSIFELGTSSGIDESCQVVVLRNWTSIAFSKWPLSYRDDARNWRLSNQKPIDRTDGRRQNEPI